MPMHTQGSFCWYECGTRDAAMAKAFYGELFGWTAVDQPMADGHEGVYTVLQRDGKAVAGLYEMQGQCFDGVPAHWGNYVWVDDVDASAATAKSLGGEVLAEPFDVPRVGRMAAVKDPQGAMLQLFKGAEHQGSEVEGMAPCAFCWSELATTDTDAAARFYTGLFGWSASAQEMGPDMTYTSFYRDEEHAVGGMMRMEGEQWKGIPPHWMNYVSVEDADDAAKEAQALKGKVLVPPTDIPGVGRFSVLQDPTGAVLSIIALAGEA